MLPAPMLSTEIQTTEGPKRSDRFNKLTLLVVMIVAAEQCADHHDCTMIVLLIVTTNIVASPVQRYVAAT